MDVKDTDRCCNCYKEFADHNYLMDSIDKYMCPVPVTKTGYGYFCGGDPRKFHPDHECCTPEEIAAHKAACEAWNRGEKVGPAMRSHWITDGEGKVIAHCSGSSYGIGTYQLEIESWFEPLDEDCGIGFED